MRSHDSIPSSIPSYRILVVVALVVLGLAATRANAGDDVDEDVDVAAFEYVDVIETVEGSILRGVVTEQRPNVRYKLATADGSVHVIRAKSIKKISKQKNPRYRGAKASKATEVEPTDELDTAPTVKKLLKADKATVASAEALPAVDESEPAVVKSSTKSAWQKRGLRISPEIAVVMPAGDLINIGGSPLTYRTSFAPGASIGYEWYAGNVGIAVGGLLRYTAWQMPVQIAELGSHSTIETQIYARAAMQLGRAMPYAGLAIGADTNRTANHLNRMSSTTVGLGANVQAGLAVAASRAVLVDVGVDYHPGTDTIESGWDASISYFALRLGATIRL